MYYYAAKNNIDVTDKEVNETLNFQKQQAENSEEFQKWIAEYLSRADMTIEQYWNVLAPESYRNSILKSRVYKHILENLTDINTDEISPEEQTNYVNQFIKDNMKIDVINKEFIDLYNNDIYELNNQ
jgi:FKBP-type peptidyl-prolyl cis-trans isomerase (trigger factor)